MAKQTLTKADIPRLASYSLAPDDHPDVDCAQMEHRINLLQQWSIPSSSRVLEFGCGQGLCTTVLAANAQLAGSDEKPGHIDAVDPAPLTYGTPTTLGEAQGFIMNSEVGGCISWHQADPEEFLKGSEETWDVAVLAHCIWYFDSPGRVKRLFTALKGRVKRVCIAEYALSASEPGGVPHVLAALGRGFMEAHRTSSENIRTLLSPREIKNSMEGAGWKVEKETVIVPGEELQDGRWEVGSFTAEGTIKEIEALDVDEGVKIMLLSARDAVIASVKGLAGGKVRTMNTYVAVFEC
ncbi:hypothetical protein BT63DRAFT_429486 [Microthyrium microscopicum]|uniref:S-adenosyl-L-methionine-dependent methyltransferase n=1 Tax=Microthyrium microscopicum TaxID=703497 RepID=A0A6A6U0V6_9PEZI|nr:hypothetical protein BT63DRAFT_429486 [Microthyrium microscopicum]